jgi:hypothetical protein
MDETSTRTEVAGAAHMSRKRIRKPMHDTGLSTWGLGMSARLHGKIRAAAAGG